MANNPFVKATKEKAFLRLALVGISGGGKTYSALNIAQHLVPGGKVAVIDTEHGSASKYAGIFDFDTVELSDFKPASYVAMITAAAANGYDVVIIDSLTHAWDALLAMKDQEAAKKHQNSFTAWGVINKHYDSLIEAIVGTPIHVIGTIRSKSDYVMEEYTVQGKTRTKPVKVGMKAMHREGFEYEFDVVAQMDIDNRFIVEKTRCMALTGEVIEKPGAEVAETLRVWLSDGVEPAPSFQDEDEYIQVDETGDLVLPPQGEIVNGQKVAPKSEPTPETQTDGDDFPTIRSVWPDVATTLQELPMEELPEGLPIGGIVGVQAKTLGYEDYDHVKRLLGLESSRHFGDTFEAFLSAVIDHAPKYND